MALPLPYNASPRVEEVRVLYHTELQRGCKPVSMVLPLPVTRSFTQDASVILPQVIICSPKQWTGDVHVPAEVVAGALVWKALATGAHVVGVRHPQVLVEAEVRG